MSDRSLLLWLVLCLIGAGVLFALQAILDSAALGVAGFAVVVLAFVVRQALLWDRTRGWRGSVDVVAIPLVVAIAFLAARLFG